MRVAFLSIHGHVDPIPNLGLTDTGGQVVYVLELAKRLGKRGAQVDIYTRWFEGKRQKEIVSENVQIIRIPCGPKRFIRKEDLFPYLDEFAENMYAYITKNNIRYDIIHSHYWDAGYVAMLLKQRENNFLWAHTSHSLGLLKKLFLGEKSKSADYKFDIRINVEKKILKSAELLISASPVEEKYVSLLYGINREFELVPPGVDTEFFKPSNTREIELPKKYIFSTGRMEWTKGFDLLVQAFGRIAHKHKDTYLILGGGSAKPTPLEMEVRNEIKRIASELRIAKKVIQTGRIPNEHLPTYYTKAKLTVLPSRYDLFGMVALESLACETPVVISKYAGVSQIVPENIGVIADPNYIDDLAERILFLLEDEGEAKIRGKKGRQFVINNFTWEQLAIKLQSIYKKAIQ